MSVDHDISTTEPMARVAATSAVPSRPTLRALPGSASAQRARLDMARASQVERAPSGSMRLQGDTVPLKRLTAGRKELKIAHDGATYLLRITKSNKLILTKAQAAVTTPAAVPS